MKHFLLRKPCAISIFLYVIAVGLFLTGCSAGPEEAGQPGRTVTTTIYGQVVDEAGAPVSGATVATSQQSATTTSDARGLFVLKNAVVPETRLVVTAKKAGFFTAARAETPRAGGATRTKLFMMSNAPNYSLSASAGGTVNITGGASVKFQAGSFQTSSGAAYSGTVKVAARYLDPADPSFADYFAGDNLGRSSDGKEEVALISCGVLRVEISGQNGEALKLDASKPASIAYPQPTSNPLAPASMPLWSFDESLGMWKEDGSATLQAGKYIGTVTHFTDWNLDYKGEIGTLEFRIVCNGVPINGVSVKIEDFFYKVGYTDGDGTIRFVRAPADKEIVILVRAEDNAGLYYINTPVRVTIAPGVVTNIGDISLDSPCPAAISGNLIDCDDKPAEGLIMATQGTNTTYTYAKNGSFMMSVPSLVPLAVIGMDVNGNQSTQIDVLPLAQGELRLIGDVKVCGTGGAGFVDVILPNTERTALGISPDGSRLATLTYEGTLTVFESSTGNKLAELALPGTHYTDVLEFSADNSKLLVVDNYSTSDIYDVSGAVITPITSVTQTYCAHMFDDGSKIVAGRMVAGITTIGLYSATDGSLIKEIHPIDIVDTSEPFNFIPDEEALIYDNYKSPGIYRVWSTATDLELRNFTIPGTNMYSLYSSDGNAVATTADGKLFVCYDSKTNAKLGEFSLTPNSNTRYSALAFTKAYSYLALTDSVVALVQCSKFSDGSIKPKLLPYGARVNALAVSRGDDYLAAAHNKGLRIWKLK